MNSNKNIIKNDEYPEYQRLENLNQTTGLSREQVAEMKSKYGTNQLKLAKASNPFILFLKQLKDPMIIILIIATIISLALGIVNATKDNTDAGHKLETITMFVETGVILAIILVNTIWGTVQEIKTEKAMQSLSKLTSPMATVLRDNNMITIPVDEVVVNDILFLDAGMSIAADGLLIESFDLQIVESVLTGESVQVEKKVGPDKPNVAIINQSNRVFAGTNVINGSGKAIVTNIGMHTQIGKIASLLNNEKNSLTPLQKQIAKLSMIIGIIAGIICLITFFAYIAVISKNGKYEITNGEIVGQSAQVAISLAVATIPEGVLAVISVILATACKLMAKHNALIKKLPAVETLGSASVICSDKTGTLTQNKMTVVNVWTNKTFKESTKKPFDKNVLIYSVLATTADINVENHKIISETGDPTETALLISLYNEWNLTKQDLLKKYDILQILPFNSDRKLMSVVVFNKETKKYYLVTKGAPDNVLARCINDKDYLKQATKINSEMADKALRVLGVAIKELKSYSSTKPLKIDLDENKLDLIGLIAEQDPVRPEAVEAIATAKKAGIIPVMITGDYKQTAIAIAKELGMAESIDQALSGQELNAMSDEELSQNIEKYRVFARVSPTDKIRIVKAWQSKDKIVSMTGDGVNDAPSLKAADIGCAMGITGTDVSKEAADIVLADDNYQTIVKAVETGRGVMQNIKHALTLLLTTNFSCLLVVFISLFMFMINPLSSLQVLWINVVSETLPGIAMGFNKPGKHLMELKPRPKNAFIVDKHMLIRILIEGIIFWIAATLMFYIGFGVTTNIWDIKTITYKFKGLTDIFNYNDLIVQGLFAGSGLMFLTLGLCLSSNAISMRTDSLIFFEPWKDMQWSVFAALGSMILLVFVAYIPEINHVFNMDLNFNTNNLASGYKALNLLPFLIAFLSIMGQEITKIIKQKCFKSQPNLKTETVIISK